MLPLPSSCESNFPGLTSRLGPSVDDAWVMLRLVWAFSAGSSVTHRTVARGSEGNDPPPSKRFSITDAATTVLPAPVGALKMTAPSSLLSSA